MSSFGITRESIINISQEIWDSMISISLNGITQTPAGILKPDGVSGRIEIFGAWRGEVEIRMSRALARSAAAAFIGKEADSVDLEECFDAAQELTNITAGRLKRLLPQICKVTVPSMCACETLVIPDKNSPEVSTVYFATDFPSLAVSIRASV